MCRLGGKRKQACGEKSCWQATGAAPDSQVVAPGQLLASLGVRLCRWGP